MSKNKTCNLGTDRQKTWSNKLMKVLLYILFVAMSHLHKKQPPSQR